MQPQTQMRGRGIQRFDPRRGLAQDPRGMVRPPMRGVSPLPNQNLHMMNQQPLPMVPQQYGGPQMMMMANNPLATDVPMPQFFPQSTQPMQPMPFQPVQQVAMQGLQPMQQPMSMPLHPMSNLPLQPMQVMQPMSALSMQPMQSIPSQPVQQPLQQQMINAPVSQPLVPPLPHTVHPSLGIPSPVVPLSTSSSASTSLTQVGTNPSASGPITSPTPYPANDAKKTRTFKAEDLKQRDDSVIADLYEPQRKCPTCGIRFKEQEKYGKHLDWHFRMNRKEKQKLKKAMSRTWFYTTEEWIKFEGDEGGEQPATPFFLREQTSEETEDRPPPSVAADESQPNCALCREKFTQYWDTDQEEWMFKNAVKVEGILYHSDCYSTSDSSTPPVPQPEPSQEDKPLSPTPTSASANETASTRKREHESETNGENGSEASQQQPGKRPKLEITAVS